MTNTCGNKFIHNFGLGRAYPTVQDRSENRNFLSLQAGVKKTSLTCDIAIKICTTKILVKYTSCDLEACKSQNLGDLLSCFFFIKNEISYTPTRIQLIRMLVKLKNRLSEL